MSKDVAFENLGTIGIIQPLTAACRDWIDEHIGATEDWQWMAGGLICEPRMMDDIAKGMVDDGLQLT